MLAYFMSNLLVIKFKYIVFFLFMDIFVIGLRVQELKVKLGFDPASLAYGGHLKFN